MYCKETCISDGAWRHQRLASAFRNGLAVPPYNSVDTIDQVPATSGIYIVIGKCFGCGKHSRLDCGFRDLVLYIGESGTDEKGEESGQEGMRGRLKSHVRSGTKYKFPESAITKIIYVSGDDCRKLNNETFRKEVEACLIFGTKSRINEPHKTTCKAQGGDVNCTLFPGCVIAKITGCE